MKVNNRGVVPRLLIAALCISQLGMILLPADFVSAFILLLVFQSILWIAVFQGRDHIPSSLALGLLLVSFISARWRLPYYEDDFFRYFWDGLHVAGLRNPYRYSPLLDTMLNFDAIRAKVRFAELETFYPPVAQLLFGALTRLSGQSLVPFLWLLAAGGAVAVGHSLSRLFRNQSVVGGTAGIWILLQHPLVVREWYSACHYDSWACAALISAVSAVSIGGTSMWVGLGANLKSPLAVLLPLLVPRRGRAALIGVSVFLVAAILPWVLFWEYGKRPFGTLLIFGTQWEMNSGVFRWIRVGLQAAGIASSFAGMYARLAVFVLWLGGAVVLWRTSALSLCEKVFWVFFLMAVLSPVANPWYFTWALPLAIYLPRYRQSVALLGFAALPLSYAFFGRNFPIRFERWWDIEHAILLGVLFLAWKNWFVNRVPESGV